ncbi:MAG: nitrate reductase 1, gamma (cytochrome b(NR)) subunit [Acidobacteria bacterium OLB17]|nr:MAG: nitrate reductase 1, gamma (cytochrome b(NR)) subunit [Acidobacteria bacterium OLB17]MCZ2392180.1 respiratory nitrate reductase subunit gamma [Acidobacteriota bacterium]
MMDNLFFIVLPYVAVTLFVVVSIYRYVTDKFSYSSLSSQLLESDELFYGVVPWHIGIIGALAGHLIGFLFPKEVLWFNGVPLRLYILETTGLVFGLLALVGIVALMWRRITTPRIRSVTSVIDTIVLVLLFAQVVLGVYTALFYRWGSSWFAASAVPYLRSLFLLQPDVEMIKPMPHIIKTHIINAFLIVAIFPFSRLVHMVSLPVEYLWRPYQVVIWNWNRKKIRGQYPTPRPSEKSDANGPASILR